MGHADPLAVLDADFAASGAAPPAPGSVRRPELHDLTDDGKPDLIAVVDVDRRTSELRVYTVRKTVVTRILALRGVLAGVELAAGHLAIREPTKDPRYVSVTDYVWDGNSMGLWDLTLDLAHKPKPTTSGAAPAAGPVTRPARANRRADARRAPAAGGRRSPSAGARRSPCAGRSRSP
ncbi:hypothetical protein O1L55_31920 [Streptomyces albulus]|nr:hypothetical protein [Streptomyces noursei]